MLYAPTAEVTMLHRPRPRGWSLLLGMLDLRVLLFIITSRPCRRTGDGCDSSISKGHRGSGSWPSHPRCAWRRLSTGAARERWRQRVDRRHSVAYTATLRSSISACRGISSRDHARMETACATPGGGRGGTGRRGCLPLDGGLSYERNANHAVPGPEWCPGGAPGC